MKYRELKLVVGKSNVKSQNDWEKLNKYQQLFFTNNNMNIIVIIIITILFLNCISVSWVCFIDKRCSP